MNTLQMKPREHSLVPTRLLVRMRDEMDRVFDRFFHEPWDVSFAGDRKTWMPALDVIDNDMDVTVKVELAGIAPKDIDVSVSGNTLILSGRKDETKEEKSENYYVNERRFGSFQRSIDLPDGVDVEKLTAEHNNGVLTVKIPRLKTAKPKHIPVKAS
jgi:HSP20 family protein